MEHYGIAAGPNATVYVADSSNHRLQKFAFAHSGRVPNGGDVQGTPLVVDKAGDDLTLSWGPSCVSSDSDYEIYEGTVSDFESHTPVVCSTVGNTTMTFMPAAQSAYYLVVPRSPTQEGSYGTDSDGNERPQGLAQCLIQELGECR